jgi:hypothetical protein
VNVVRNLRFALAVVILVGLAWQATRVDAGILRELPMPQTMPLFAAVLAGTASCFALFRAWAALRPGAEWRRLAPGWFASLLARYLPGGVWQGLARVGAAHAAGESKRDALEWHVAELLLACGSAALLAVVLAGIGESNARFPRLLLAAIAVAAFASSAIGRRAGFALGWTGAAACWTLCAHVLMAAGFAALAQAWFPSSSVAATFAMAAFLAAGLAGVLAVFVPAGLGIREAVLAALLAPGLGAGPAIAIALAARLWLVGCELIAWAIATSLWRRRTDPSPSQ